MDDRSIFHNKEVTKGRRNKGEEGSGGGGERAMRVVAINPPKMKN